MRRPLSAVLISFPLANNLFNCSRLEFKLTSEDQTDKISAFIGNYSMLIISRTWLLLTLNRNNILRFYTQLQKLQFTFLIIKQVFCIFVNLFSSYTTTKSFSCEGALNLTYPFSVLTIYNARSSTVIFILSCFHRFTVYNQIKKRCLLHCCTRHVTSDIIADYTFVSCLRGQAWQTASVDPFCFSAQWSFLGALLLKKTQRKKYHHAVLHST